jgi:hypothetical protein
MNDPKFKEELRQRKRMNDGSKVKRSFSTGDLSGRRKD